MMDKRLFIGIKIKIEDKLLAGINDIKKSLKDEYIKWVEIENLHITLLFIGNVKEEKIPEIIKKLGSVKCNLNSECIKFMNFGVFRNIHQPGVLWIGIDPVNQLKELKAQIDQSIINAGLEIKPEENFHPHLTLARPKFIRNRNNLKTQIEKFKGYIFQEIKPEKFQLFESKLSPHGPVYSIMSEFSPD